MKEAAQLKSAADNYTSDHSPIQTKRTEKVIQRAEGDTYTDNVDALKDHMKGEWDGKDGTGLIGGHWLPGIKSKWSTNVQLDGADNGASDGIYFSALPKSSGNLPSHTTGTRPSWYIRKNGNTSRVKQQSSFWTSGWSWGDFRNYLSASIALSGSHKWKTTNYSTGIIKWDSTSSGTNAFPYEFTNSNT
ncbi:MAG: hypothetical protein HRT57_07600 [Crocinitomicaceae bacterium]|nr:hypothetical protein [Crocinitomicaceae bacterium]